MVALPSWVLVTLLASVGLVMATSAEAQTREWTGNGFVRVNGAHQSGNRSFQERLSFLLYDEVADYTIQHTSTSGVVFEIGGGLRMWRSIAAAISFTSFQTRSTLDVSGSVPHPLFFERPRTARLQRTDSQLSPARHALPGCVRNPYHRDDRRLRFRRAIGIPC